MADVSVRFQVAGDAEVVLNLPLPQAVRLLEAIAHKVGEAMSATGGTRPPTGAGWGDQTISAERRPQG